MKRTFLSLLAVLAIISCLDASLFTLTGEMRAPDAYVLPSKAAKFQFTNFMRKERSAPGTEFQYKPFFLIQGGVPYTENKLEVGAMGGDEMYWFHAKLKLIDETYKMWQVAIGLDNIASKAPENSQVVSPTDDLYNNPDRMFYEKNSFYAVASKQYVLKGILGIPELSTVLNLGIGGNRFVGQKSFTQKFPFNGFFGSVEVRPLPQLALLGEVDGHNLNIGAKYDWKRFSAKIGYMGFEESLKKNNPNYRFGLALSYTMDQYADTRRRPIIPESQIMPGGGDVTTTGVGQTPTGVQNATTNELMEELRKIRESRADSQKALEDLRRQLADLEKEASGE